MCTFFNFAFTVAAGKLFHALMTLFVKEFSLIRNLERRFWIYRLCPRVPREWLVNSTNEFIKVQKSHYEFNKTTTRNFSAKQDPPCQITTGSLSGVYWLYCHISCVNAGKEEHVFTSDLILYIIVSALVSISVYWSKFKAACSRLNVSKTKVMIINQSEEQPVVHAGSDTIAIVDQFNYLGVGFMITNQGGC